MTRSDARKTKQQLIDELNSLRLELDELKQAASGLLLSAIVDIAADGIISIDENQRITHFNKGAEQIFGYRAQELIGESLDILLPDQFRSGHAKRVQGFASEQSASRLMNERAEIVLAEKRWHHVSGKGVDCQGRTPWQGYVNRISARHWRNQACGTRGSPNSG